MCLGDKNMYECKLSKKWTKDMEGKLFTDGNSKGFLPLCCYCFKFMSEADACLEDSMLTSLMYATGKKTKPTTFFPKDYVPKEVKEWFT